MQYVHIIDKVDSYTGCRCSSTYSRYILSMLYVHILIVESKCSSTSTEVSGLRYIVILSYHIMIRTRSCSVPHNRILCITFQVVVSIINQMYVAYKDVICFCYHPVLSAHAQLSVRQKASDFTLDIRICSESQPASSIIYTEQLDARSELPYEEKGTLELDDFTAYQSKSETQSGEKTATETSALLFKERLTTSPSATIKHEESIPVFEGLESGTSSTEQSNTLTDLNPDSRRRRSSRRKCNKVVAFETSNSLLPAKSQKKRYLSEKDEAQLVRFVQRKIRNGEGCTKVELFHKAVQLAERKGTPFPQGQPTKYWLERFRKKYPSIALRTMQESQWYADQRARTNMTTEPYLLYFSRMLVDTGLQGQPHRIWTMDDRGLQLSHKSDKDPDNFMSGRKASKRSLNRETITTIVCGNAEGTLLPPFILFPWITDTSLLSYDTERAPEGSQISVCDTSWTQRDILKMWFESCFLQHIGPQRPQILIFGGYEKNSHPGIPELAMEHSIHCVALPPHTSGWNQPLVCSVYKTFTRTLFEECDKLTATTGRELTNSEFFKVFTAAWRKMMPTDLKNGFSACGINL